MCIAVPKTLRKARATALVTCKLKVFAGSICKLIYDSVGFQILKVLRKGSEFSHNYDIRYTIITK